MKKIIFSLLVVCFSATLFGQTLLIQNFDGASLPAGWTVLNNPSNWKISNSANAGGSPRELQLNYNPTFNAKSRVMSPIIDLTGITDLVIEFLQYLDNYSGSHIIGIETTSDGGTTWNLAFQKTFSSTQGSKITEIISTPDVGSSTFQFCLFYQGYSYNINDWYFDNFKLFARYNTDAEVTSMNSLANINNAYHFVTGSNTVNVTVTNLGKQTINTIELSYQLNDEQIVSETFNSFNLTSLGSKTVSFTQPLQMNPGTSTLKINVVTVNGVADDNPENDLFTAAINVATQEGTRRVCIEHFTSSTCPPCVGVNQQMKSLTDNPANAGKFGITKYQMSWPAPGDPYYTAEGGTRRTYYGVNAVPMVFFNAKANSVNQTVFNNALTVPAFIDIDGNYEINGKNIIINANIKSYLDIPSVRAYVIVNEKKTTGNVGNNGEKEFFHVMMKMLPNANGQTISLTAGETKSLNFDFDMSSTNVEEMDDLEVHVFLQDYNSKYIFNSNFLISCVPPSEPVSFAAEVDEKSVILSWEDTNIETVNFTLLFNGVKLIDNLSEKTYTHENVPAGAHSYEVFAANENCASDIAKIDVELCQKPINFSGQVDDSTVILNWENDYGKISLFFNGTILDTDNTANTFTHENVPEGVHTYGIKSNGINCISEMVETTVEVVIIGIRDYDKTIKIYPNPAYEYLIIESEEITSVIIYNNIGQIVKNITSTSDMNRINTTDLGGGLYHLLINTKSGKLQSGSFIILK
ncbi:MAG: T9SS type A sorting domain-containing protein [Bacteroidales bacterium]|nr:T9SS type A sorting domain-containing protein [Bacteroidales bacterium]